MESSRHLPARTGRAKPERTRRRQPRRAELSGAAAELAALLALARSSRRAARALDVERLRGLYAAVLEDHALLPPGESAREARRELALLLAEAHGWVARPEPRAADSWAARLARFAALECPRTLRAEGRTLLFAFALFYGLAAASWLLVARDPELARTLFDSPLIDTEIEQLAETAPGEPFRGNFEEIPSELAGALSGVLAGHNIWVALLFFGAGLVPPLFIALLATNALMLGCYVGTAGHWGRAGEISSILVCHGTFELQAIVLAGAAGLTLARGLYFPGPWTRGAALERAAPRALRLLAPVPVLLLLAALIEGLISPFAPTAVRLGVALLSAAALAAWALLCGRDDGDLRGQARGAAEFREAGR